MGRVDRRKIKKEGRKYTEKNSLVFLHMSIIDHRHPCLHIDMMKDLKLFFFKQNQLCENLKHFIWKKIRLWFKIKKGSTRPIQMTKTIVFHWPIKPTLGPGQMFLLIPDGLFSQDW